MTDSYKELVECIMMSKNPKPAEQYAHLVAKHVNALQEIDTLKAEVKRLNSLVGYT